MAVVSKSARGWVSLWTDVMRVARAWLAVTTRSVRCASSMAHGSDWFLESCKYRRNVPFPMVSYAWTVKKAWKSSSVHTGWGVIGLGVELTPRLHCGGTSGVSKNQPMLLVRVAV